MGWFGGRGSVEKKLKQVSSRLVHLRDELRVIDEQLLQLRDEADDAALRALVSESPAAGPEHREARGHADAMASHRAHVVAEIATLETRQDQLLDELAARSGSTQ